ncbi:MAG: hypothetical protein JWP35_3806, partial [Caulobacter sp.]|nr:hypothetical protein [Caulobacter sp.]
PGAAPGALPALPAAPVAPVICRPPGVPSEIHGCVVVGISACQAVWSRDNQVLVVNTQGEPLPGAIDNLYWATAGEAADYRAGRK